MDNTISALDKIFSERKDASPDASYVAQLHNEGLNKILEKISEETTELKDLGLGGASKKMKKGQN